MPIHKNILTALLVVTTLLSAQVSAQVTLPKIIGSNMVLQRHQPVAVWGNASAGEKIKVAFGKQVKYTTAAQSGKWMIYLDKMEASNKPATMTITATNTIVLSNILVGEVWLCSGQSNMEFTMAKSSKFANAKRSKGLDSAATANERNPDIRLFLVRRDLTKPDGAGANKGWNETEITYLKDFSAPGYYFAKNLFAQLNVPVGMIASSVSGSAIEPWMSGEPRTVLNQNGVIEGVSVDHNEGKFYHGMIKPLAPYTIKGFLWYQGETNCFQNETTEYTHKFKHLISSWRTLWNNPGAPFYFVQIAPHSYSKGAGKYPLDQQSLPRFREAQAAALRLPNTGMIITTDLVDNIDDIHPTYKWEIGRRLALLALNKTYGKKVVSSGPVISKIKVNGNIVELSFTETGSGLISSDNQPLTWFEVAGSDGKFVTANAVIQANKVLVSSPVISAPVHVRFGFNEAAQPNLFNKEGLPAVPFRTDFNNLFIAKNK